MSGLRIKHAEVTSRTLTVVDRSRPYKGETFCSTCGVFHVFKTYHIELDGVGAAIVSHEVWAMLQRIPAHGFSLENEVKHPPAKIIGFGVRRG